MKFVKLVKAKATKKDNLEIAQSLINQYGKDYIVKGLNTPYTKDFIWKLLYRDSTYTEKDLGEIRDIILNKLDKKI